ncbi:MAG: hypothetical protein MUW56_14460 [Chryseobacterium sp.]|uniref:hypothetical protein n=1 Tax=Chryseobacterium sp. TaxID=1871047 RepID=UPI0025C1B1B7|nr:hypothetical protein [Chryseobacterium sp.]MCJ7934789.1 hypothetical protein [Chryseobacterium sp.]
MKKLQSISKFESNIISKNTQSLINGGSQTLQPQENITCVSSQGSDTQTVTYDDNRTVVSTGPIIVWKGMSNDLG